MKPSGRNSILFSYVYYHGILIILVSYGFSYARKAYYARRSDRQYSCCRVLIGHVIFALNLPTILIGNWGFLFPSSLVKGYEESLPLNTLLTSYVGGIFGIIWESKITWPTKHSAAWVLYTSRKMWEVDRTEGDLNYPCLNGILGRHHLRISRVPYENYGDFLT